MRLTETLCSPMKHGQSGSDSCTDYPGVSLRKWLAAFRSGALGSAPLAATTEGPLVRVYAVVVAGGFRRYATYRVATLAGVFTNAVFGFILAYTYMALWDQRPRLGGYDLSQALT